VRDPTGQMRYMGARDRKSLAKGMMYVLANKSGGPDLAIASDIAIDTAREMFLWGDGMLDNMTPVMQKFLDDHDARQRRLPTMTECWSSYFSNELTTWDGGGFQQ
jgi:hypothetical protein